MCSMGLDLSELGHPEQPLLRKAPLVLSLCQMRFQDVLGFDEKMVRPLQVALNEEFPIVARQLVQQAAFGPEGISLGGGQQQIFQFNSAAKDWTVSISSASLSLQTTGYKGFYDFAERWKTVAQTCMEALGIRQQDRLGLRYVNQLAAPADVTREELATRVRPDLLGVIGAHEHFGHVRKAWQELRFDQDDGGKLTLQHGYDQRAPADWAYVLDFDHYDEEPQPIDIDGQLRTLATFNHRIFDLFKWSVDERFFETFEPETPTEQQS
jgi:uncharacterized protein (TIGR04255 family)